jgi:hypothetical protein
MTLTEVKDRFGMCDLDMRFLINSNLKSGIDYFMETVGHKRVFNFTELGDNKITSLIRDFRKEESLC